MSNFWGKILTAVPRFRGTDAEKAANVASHNFRTTYLRDQFPEIYDQSLSVVNCMKCGKLEGSGYKDWPCGAAPEEITMEEWTKSR